MNEQSKMKCACCGKDLSNHDAFCIHDEKQPEDMVKWEDSMIEQYGFYIHYVPDTENEYVDCHTHGLTQSFDHPELQIVLSIPAAVVVSIMHDIVDMIRDGRKLEDGDLLDKIIESSPVLLAKMKDKDAQEYFRIVLPDKNWKLPTDESCASGFKKQMEEDLVW